MRRMEINEKWIYIVPRLCRSTTARISLGNKLTNNIKTSKGLKQGCTLSPLLFNIYIEQALENWYRICGPMGISVEGKALHSLMFADDQVVFAQEEEDMKYMLCKLKKEYDKWGLNLNFQNTEYMCVGEQMVDLQTEEFTIKVQEDIQEKIIKGKRAIKALHGTIWNKNLAKQTKTNIFRSIVESITTYGGEMWPMTKTIRDQIRTVELDYMRRCLQYTRRDKIRTEKIWQEMEVKESITKRIENKALRWYGHVRRMSEERWPKKILEWQPRGKRRRARPAVKWKQFIDQTMQEKGLEEGDWNNREYWHLRTTNL